MSHPSADRSAAARNYAVGAALLQQWQASARPQDTGYAGQLVTAALAAMVAAVAIEMGVPGLALPDVPPAPPGTSQQDTSQQANAHAGY